MQFELTSALSTIDALKSVLENLNRTEVRNGVRNFCSTFSENERK